MSEMVKRVAAALYARFHLRSNRPAWDAAPEKTKAAFRCDARAVIDAALAEQP